MFVFFFKQKTAYEMLRSLVGSEMCIRDSVRVDPLNTGASDFIHLCQPDGGKSCGACCGLYNLSLIHI